MRKINRMLFFVGCDKVGKSTLFSALLKRTNQHICIDRFTACQYVYGNHLGKTDTPSIQTLRRIESDMAKSGGIFVHVTAHEKDIIKRFEEHNETDIEIDQISKILYEYELYLRDTPMPVISINTSILNIEESVEEILKYAERDKMENPIWA